jgi:hypothetical protein
MSEERALYKPSDNIGSVVERVIVAGDLKELSPGDRVQYYKAVCESLGLNPLTRPFDYITLNAKLTLYARRDCTDQLRRIHRINVAIVSREKLDDVYVVTARAITTDGRQDESIGAVSLGSLRGDALANALMKAETKAKRRVTLSIVGLGWLDETEVGTVPGAMPVQVNSDTGEIVTETPAPAPSPTPPPAPQTNGGPSRPWNADMLKAKMLDIAQKLEAKAGTWTEDGISKLAQDMRYIGNDAERHSFVWRLFGERHTDGSFTGSLKECSKGELHALDAYLRLGRDGKEAKANALRCANLDLLKAEAEALLADRPDGWEQEVAE